MRNVTGYLTEDGAFYESADDAERHEATHALIGAYNQYVGRGGNIERFQNVIINLSPEIRRYLNAIEGPAQPDEVAVETELAEIERGILDSRKRQDKTDKYPSDDGLGGTLEGMEQQSDRGPVHVPDVGDRPRAKAV